MYYVVDFIRITKSMLLCVQTRVDADVHKSCILRHDMCSFDHLLLQFETKYTVSCLLPRSCLRRRTDKQQPFKVELDVLLKVMAWFHVSPQTFSGDIRRGRWSIQLVFCCNHL